MREDFEPRRARPPVPRRSYARLRLDDNARPSLARPTPLPTRNRAANDITIAPASPLTNVATNNKQPVVEPPNAQASNEIQKSSSPQIVKRKGRLKKHSRTQLALVSMAFLMFGLGILVNVQTLQTNHNAKAQVSALAQKSDNNSDGTADVPSESKPPSHSLSSYQVSPLAPKYLVIPTLGINTRILSVGITKSGELGTPNNIYDTAWYSASARPGDPGSNGAVLIDGHVHGPTLPGVFVNLKKLQPGNLIQIVRGDNQTFIYKVVKTQNYDASTMNMAMMLSSIQPGEAGLNLITCGGPYDKVSGEYTQRTAVFAVQQ